MVGYFFREKNNVARRLALQLAVTHVLSESRDLDTAFERLLEVLGKIERLPHRNSLAIEQHRKVIR